VNVHGKHQTIQHYIDCYSNQLDLIKYNYSVFLYVV